VTNDKTLIAQTDLGYTVAYFEKLEAKPESLRKILEQIRQAVISAPAASAEAARPPRRP
jgi:hypothetical protein